MAKWGTSFIWHGGTQWGQAGGGGVTTAPYECDVVWVVNIEWVAGSVSNESAYTRDIAIDRGRQHYISPSGRGFEKMQIGKCVITLDNSNGRYDPYNTTSPLYPNVLPGRKIQILVYDVANKTMYVRFTGHVTDIQPSSGINEVSIICEDGMRWLSDAEYNTYVLYSKTTSQAIDLTLSFVSWPYGKNIQSSVQPLQVFEPGSGLALNLIQQLADANLGTFFIDRQGKAVFYPVSYDVTTTHTIDQSVLLREIRVPQPWETVRNKITVVANRKGKRPSSTVWQLGSSTLFTAGQTKPYHTKFQSSVGLTVSKIVANTAKAKTGVDVSTFFTIVIGEQTATGCVLNITNNYTASAYLITLKITGNLVVSAPEDHVSTDTTSITTYGPRSFLLDNPCLQDRNYADRYAIMIKDLLKDPHKEPIIQIQERPSVQYPIDLYDKVALVSSNLSINATYTVGGISEKWMSDTGQSVLTTLYLQTVLYDSTDITPDPFDPGDLEEIENPYVPPYIPPYIPPPPPPPTGTCLSVGAPSVAPVYITPTYGWVRTLKTLPEATLSLDMPYPCILRPGNALNKSVLALFATSYDWGGLQWIANANNYLTITAYNYSGVNIASSTLSYGGWTTYATFAPAAATEVAGFRAAIYESSDFEGDSDYASSSDYPGIFGAIGPQFGAGVIDPKSSTGTLVSGLVIGNGYMVVGYDGPWYYDLSLNTSFITQTKPISTWDGDLALLDMSGVYARQWFVATQTTCAVRCGDNLFTDNSGSMEFQIYNANIYDNTDIRVDINWATIANVCASDIRYNG